MSGATQAFGGNSPRSTANKTTIQDILTAGGDPAKVLCQLTNDIHPIFQAKNICGCEYKDIRFCVQPHFANLARSQPGTARAPTIASPHAGDNLFVRATMQLASRILTHDDTLPFWAGILDCWDPKTQKFSFKFDVDPSRHLSVERRDLVLDHLHDFVDRVRFHYKANDVSRTLALGIDPKEPDWNRNVIGQYFAHRNGRPVVETGNPPFANIVLDVSDMRGYDQSAESWKQCTVSALKREIFNGARLLCHELAHCLLTYTFGFEQDPPFNDEKMIETGFSLENFLFGGVVRRDHDGIRLASWPNKAIWEEYKAGGTTIVLHGPLDAFPTQERLVHPDAYECFLTDEFWEDPEVSKGRFKKLWLRPSD